MDIRQFRTKMATAIQAGKLTPALARQISDDAIRGQEVHLSLPYYSRIYIRPVRTAGPPVNWALAAGTEFMAFGYGLNEDMAPAGWAGNLATASDTNLATAREPNDGEDVLIYGIACHVVPWTDAQILRSVAGQFSATLRFGNKTFAHLGSIGMIPGRSQMKPGDTTVLAPSTIETAGARMVSPPSLGDGLDGNFLRFREPILWTAQGAQSKMDILVRCDYAIDQNSDLARAAAAAPIEELQTVWDPPAATGDVWCALTFSLVVATSGPRGVNR